MNSIDQMNLRFLVQRVGWNSVNAELQRIGNEPAQPGQLMPADQWPDEVREERKLEGRPVLAPSPERERERAAYVQAGKPATTDLMQRFIERITRMEQRHEQMMLALEAFAARLEQVAQRPEEGRER